MQKIDTEKILCFLGIIPLPHPTSLLFTLSLVSRVFYFVSLCVEYKGKGAFKG